MTSATQDNLSTTTLDVTIQADQARAISPDLFGIFFEDINYAADGGLYAELIQNRSFEYSSADQSDWNFFTAWELIQAGGKCTVELATASPLHPNNPHYIVLNIDTSQGDAHGAVGLRNTGFDGIVLKAGESYDISLFARALTGQIGNLTVRLESRTGSLLAETTLPAPTDAWSKYTGVLHPTADEHHARCVVSFSGSGSVALDVISLFPQKTFRHRPNGLRPDLAQVIADLKPRFVRFPGGCLAHGDGLDNMYRWKDTIGPLESRKEQSNIWNYHQTVGLGYYEYFQFCEDIGAKPLPIVPAGTCCPNTGAKFNGLWEQGQQGLPMDEMADYVQEVLDLIEWANGPATSTWGAKRAAAGHPEPFGLEYIGLGNEDRITPLFKERFKLIYEAVKANYPAITVIGTVGPRPEGEDYELGWDFARELHIEMVDEHGYKSPQWFWDNVRRYDTYDRASAAVYLGEYAAHDLGRRNTLNSALSEAAFMTSLERNGDLVRLSSYAPLLAKRNRTQWLPDLIYFDNVSITPSINYYVQQLFAQYSGDVYLPVTVKTDHDPASLAISCVQSTTTGDIVVKIVSNADLPLPSQLDVSSLTGDIAPTATCIVLTGAPQAENVFGKSPVIPPTTLTLAVGTRFAYDVPAHSLSVLIIKALQP